MKLLKKGSSLSNDIENYNVDLTKVGISSLLTTIISIPILNYLMHLFGYNDILPKFIESSLIVMTSFIPNALTFISSKVEKEKAKENLESLRKSLEEENIYVTKKEILNAKYTDGRRKRIYYLKDIRDNLVFLKERVYNSTNKLYLVEERKENVVSL